MLSFFSTDLFYSIMDRINGYVGKNSLDPVQPDMAGTMRERPCIKDLIDNFNEVKAELLAASAYSTSIQGDVFFGEDITNDGKWHKFILKWYSKPTPNAKIQCPRTLEILERHKDIRLAMVSILEPGARIHSHRGPWKGSIRCLLGIQTPNSEQCYLDVNDGNKLSFYDKELVAFDDTYDHFAINDTQDSRIVLFLDCERKMRTWHSKFFVWLANRTICRLTARE